MVGVEVDKASLAKIKKGLDRLSLKNQQKELHRILKNSSLPIRKRAKQKAKRVIGLNRGGSFTRTNKKGEESSYDILPDTVEKSIGNIVLKRAKVSMVDVGYRTKGKYNGWFAHFVDAGTANRDFNGADRGKIEPRNIMRAGLSKIPQAKILMIKNVEKLLKKLSK